jgi:hypothetical protein
MIPALNPRPTSGASLADVLIATVILGIGIAAASSLSLSISTQEEIATRVSRGASMVENIAMLYGLGLDRDAVLTLMPTDPYVTLSAGSENTETIGGDLVLRYIDVTATINTVDNVGSWSPGYWTGGGDGNAPRQRTISVRAYRSSHQLRNDQTDSPGA